MYMYVHVILCDVYIMKVGNTFNSLPYKVCSLYNIVIGGIPLAMSVNIHDILKMIIRM